MFNDICEQVVEYWQKTRQILPEVFNLRPDLIEEVADGINDEYADLLNELRALCVH